MSFRSGRGPTVGGVPQGGEERPPSALAQEGKEQATETVQRKRRGEGRTLWAKGLGTWAGDIQAEAQEPLGTQTTRERGGSSQRVLPVPRRCSSECQQTGPQKVTATSWRRREPPLALQSPVCLGLAARPQARGSLSLSGQGIWPRLPPFRSKGVLVICLLRRAG